MIQHENMILKEQMLALKKQVRLIYHVNRSQILLADRQPELEFTLLFSSKSEKVSEYQTQNITIYSPL